MIPETIIQAVVEIGEAAETEREALLGGADFGRMLIAQFKAQGTARRWLGCASRAKIERTLEQLTRQQCSYQGQVAVSALEAWRHALLVTGAKG